MDVQGRGGGRTGIRMVPDSAEEVGAGVRRLVCGWNRGGQRVAEWDEDGAWMTGNGVSYAPLKWRK